MKTNYKNYVSKMSFLVKPDDPVPKDMQLQLDSKLHPLPSFTDMKNVKLSLKDKKTKNVLGDVCKIPKMCTFAIGALINLIVSEMPKDLVFVNIGVWYGFSFFCGIINNPGKKCVGVDNFTEFCDDAVKKAFYDKFAIFRGPDQAKHLFFDMDYLEYFEKYHKGKIGFYAYDADHREEAMLQALMVAEPFFADDCLILLDDINWSHVMKGIDRFLEQSGYEYNVLVKQHTCDYIHPSFWNGILLMQKSKKKTGE